jgi:hypothetical protein
MVINRRDRDEARRIAANMAKLPEQFRAKTWDIPRSI